MESFYEYASYILVFLCGVLMTLFFVMMTEHLDLKREIDDHTRSRKSHLH